LLSGDEVQLQRRSCPVCAHSGPFAVFAEARLDPTRLSEYSYASRKVPELMHLRLVECGRCDLLFADAIPDEGELTAAYRSAAFDSREEAQWASRTYGGLVDRLVDRLPSREAALDIGTGEGSFLEELEKRGFRRPLGVEPSAAPLDAAASRIRANIRAEAFDPRSFAGERFSLVTCFQTLEHVPDPKQLVRGALSLLEPGGAFLSVCHDRRALSAALMGRRSPIFDIEHLQLFSRASGGMLLAEAGLERVECHPLVNHYPLRYWMKLLPIPAAPKLRLLDLLAGSGLGRLPLPLPAGNLVLFGFRPMAVQAAS
jgi:SAM-dependent methyltransferase